MDSTDDVDIVPPLPAVKSLYSICLDTVKRTWVGPTTIFRSIPEHIEHDIMDINVLLDKYLTDDWVVGNISPNITFTVKLINNDGSIITTFPYNKIYYNLYFVNNMGMPRRIFTTKDSNNTNNHNLYVNCKIISHTRILFKCITYVIMDEDFGLIDLFSSKNSIAIFDILDITDLINWKLQYDVIMHDRRAIGDDTTRDMPLSSIIDKFIPDICTYIKNYV